MKRIIYTRPDGGTSIIVPSTDSGLSIEELAAKDVPAGLSYEIVDTVDIPNDRTFRDAWFHDTTPAPQKIGVDLAKAQAISHDKRRAKRTAEFAPLDVQATIPAKAAQAEAARQAIRDKHDAIQIEIDAAADADALKAILVREGL